MDDKKTKSMPNFSILGGGPAGLAVGYYCGKHGFPFSIFEAADTTGGNCRTFEHGDFLYDSGAHRLHDKDPEMTAEVKSIMGAALRKVNIPSQIYHAGKFIDFPLSPLNLIKRLGPWAVLRAGTDFMAARLGAGPKNKSFESYAVKKYGRSLAEAFLLNYSEKLWGSPCSRLSPSIAGKRLKGLDLRSFITEAVLGSKARTEHMEGSFYYPSRGIGTIMQRLHDLCGPGNIRTGTRVTKLYHESGRIRAVELNGSETVEVVDVVCTLPLNQTLEMLEPAAPPELVELASSLRYRNIVLVAHFLDNPGITGSATVYFPDKDVPFTRLYEPRNRSADMSPEGKTSLVVEIPCQDDDVTWNYDDEKLTGLVRGVLAKVGWIKDGEVLGSETRRLKNAYPILELGYDDKVREINSYLGGFKNLAMSGRNGRFQYSWIHDMMRAGKEIVEARLHGGSA